MSNFPFVSVVDKIIQANTLLRFFGLGSVAYFVSLSVAGMGSSKSKGKDSRKLSSCSLPMLYRLLRAKYRCRKVKTLYIALAKGHCHCFLYWRQKIDLNFILQS